MWGSVICWPSWTQTTTAHINVYQYQAVFIQKQFKNSSFVNILQKTVSFFLVVSAKYSCRTNQLHYCFSFTEKYKSTLVHIKLPHIRFELKRHSLQTIEHRPPTFPALQTTPWLQTVQWKGDPRSKFLIRKGWCLGKDLFKAPHTGPGCSLELVPNLQSEETTCKIAHLN